MAMEYEAVIGLEVHAELLTRSKMFCGCPVVDATQSRPNIAICPVCSGLPGVLPVINEQAVAHAVKVALALDCQIATTSIFARKNYFYPDLPKGYQISQYEYPLAERGHLRIQTGQGERDIQIRRVHMEEDTGKLTHIPANGSGAAAYSLVDLNRAGVPLLEIVSEPDMRTLDEVRAYAEGLRAILRYLGVNSGDMEKGVIRFEANVSVRPVGSQTLGTRVEIKNLNSFRALERASAYQIQKQIEILEAGGVVHQETLGWNEALGETYTQRSKEEAHDYRYFPEPDLPPLVIEQAWIDQIATSLPELPEPKARRFQQQYELGAPDAFLLAQDQGVANYFEAAAAAASQAAPRVVANWITGEIFGWMNQTGRPFESLAVSPKALAELISLAGSEINLNTAKNVLAEMLSGGQHADEIIRARGLGQISEPGAIAALVAQVLADNPVQLANYLAGKQTLSNWFFGQVMRAAQGQANPQVLRAELERQLAVRK
jgi:aspartyl-tRNA(Asn)/glutamyl-tRNA(Gln) amidotransferase subunit B